MGLWSPKIGKCRELDGTITLEKLLGIMKFVKIAYWAPKGQNSSQVVVK